MKKFLSAMVALAMTGAMCTPVFAETVTENGGESETSVKGTYVASENTPTVYLSLIHISEPTRRS